MSWSLADLARRVEGEVIGDPQRVIDRVQPLDDAGPGDLSFVADRRHLAAARSSGAGALVVARDAPRLPQDQIRVEDPPRAIAAILELMYPLRLPEPGTHGTAVIAADAVVAASASIGPFCVVGPGSMIGDGAVLEAHVVVGDGCEVGARCRLHPHVVLYSRVRLAAGVEVHAGSVLGADGFRYASSAEGHRKVPQVGGLEVAAEVEIGALTAVDRGALVDTRIGEGSKIDNLVQVGHNARIGRHVLLCGQSGVAGSARLGDFVVLAGQVGVTDHVEIGAGARVAAKSAVLADVASGETVAGIPAIAFGEWKRRRVLEGKLAEIWRLVRRMARRLGAGGSDETGG